MEGLPAHAVEKLAKHRVRLYHLGEDPAAAVPLVDGLTEPRGPGLAGEADADEDLRRHLTALGYADDEGGSASAPEWLDPDCDCAWCARFR